MKDRIEILSGGNVNSEIEKRGNCIYRNNQGNVHIHNFLKYLEMNNFSGVPKFLGCDDDNHEILSFLPGYVPGNDFPNCHSFIWSLDNLISVAKFMRSFHDLSKNFLQSHQWQSSLFDQQECEVVCHNDGAPYNFVYANKKFVGIIDFDMAYPAPYLWDIAYTLYTNVPLASYQPDLKGETRPYELKDAAIRKERIKMFFRAYGLELPEDLFIWVKRRLEELCNFIIKEADNGNKSFQKMVEQGEVNYYLNEIIFIKNNYEDWL